MLPWSLVFSFGGKYAASWTLKDFRSDSQANTKSTNSSRLWH
jgi:hypothetical protein